MNWVLNLSIRNITDFYDQGKENHQQINAQTQKENADYQPHHLQHWGDQNFYDMQHGPQIF